MPRVAGLPGFQARSPERRGFAKRLMGENSTIFGLGIACALAIFILDINLEEGVAVGFLYLVVVWIASAAPHGDAIWLAALACCAFVLIGWLYSPEAEQAWKVIANRGLSCLFIVLTAAGLHERRAGEIGLRKLAAIVTSTDDAVIGNTLDGKITCWNEAAERLYGYTAEEMIGTSIDRLAPPYNPGEPADNLARVRRGERIERSQTVRMHKSGLERHVSLTVSPVHDAMGRIVGIATIAREIGSRVAAEKRQQEATRKIEELNQKLAQSNADLDRFASVASHDLKAPLRRIRSFAELLGRQCGSGLPPEAHDSLSRMNSSVAHMQAMIDALLDFSRIGSGNTGFDSVGLQDVVRSADEQLSLQIEEAGAVVDIGPLPEIEGDALLLHQLFQNLLSNALKFRKPGRPPKISVSAETSGAGDERCDIAIADNGIGFDSEDGERIFSIFERLHGEDAYTGTGIGLAVCRRVAEHHNGMITAAGVPDEGSVFTVTLPLSQS